MPKYTTVIPTSGPDGNMLVILGNAMKFLRQLNVDESEITALKKKVFASENYEEACGHVRVYFPLEGDDAKQEEKVDESSS